MNYINNKENSNNVVKKHNDIIKAKGALSSTAQKMLAMLIAMLRQDDTELQEYALNKQSYLEAIGSGSNNVDMLDKQALELMRNPFYILNENNERDYFNWCSKVSPDRIEGYIIFSIHQDLKPYLLELKENFTQYELVNIMNLKGNYSPRLYELFIAKWHEYINYKKNSKSYTFNIKIDELRELVGIPKSYLYGNIKQQILDKAKQDFKKYTDIKFDYKEQKIGRKVVSLDITITANDKGSNDKHRSLQSFVKYVRRSYAPDVEKSIYPLIVKINEKEALKVNLKGELYISNSNGTMPSIMNKEEAKTWWETLYNASKNGEIEI